MEGSQKVVIGAELRLESAQSLESVGQFRAALKEANKALMQVQADFGATSQEAIKAARYVADLRDRMNEAKEVSDLFDPGAKFAAVTNAASAIAAGFSTVQATMALVGGESEELEKSLLKVQAAMALTQGLSTVADSAKHFTRLADVVKTQVTGAFVGLRGVLMTLGLGAIIGMIATIASHWDSIKEKLTGVSGQMRDNVDAAKKDGEAQQEKLDALSQQDNILKLQGKSEREILQLKIKQIDAVIKAKEAELSGQKAIMQASVQMERRNRLVLRSFLNMVVQPIQLIIDGVAKVAKFFGQDFEFDISDKLSRLVFDEDSVREEAEKVVKEVDEQITKLKNQRAGMQLSIQQIDRQAYEKRLAQQKQAHQKELEAEKEKKRLTDQLLKEVQEERAPEGENRELVRLRRQYEEHKRILSDSALLEEWYAVKKAGIQDKYADEANKKQVEEIEAQIQREREAEARRIQLRYEGIEAIKGAAAELAMSEEMSWNFRRQLLEQAEAAMLANTQYTEAERLSLQKSFSDARQEIDRQEVAAKQEMMQNIGSILGSFADLAGEKTVAGKALAVAETTISTYLAAQKAYQSQMMIPDPSSPVRAAIAAGAAIAEGLVRVRNILKVQVPGKSGGGSMPSLSLSAGNTTAPVQPAVPQSVVTSIDADSVNRIGNQAIKAYVLESDVTNNQERIIRINRAARLG